MRQANDHPSDAERAETWSLSRIMQALRRLPYGCILVLAPLTASGQSTSQTLLSNPPPRPSGVLIPEANRIPDANQQMEMREEQTKKQNFEAANLERKKQIAEDSAKLLKLATDLKTEIDKTNKDTLSLSVIRKAEEIERLAHIVKEKMKLTMGGS